MSNDKNKEPRGNSENTPRERPRPRDTGRDIPSPEGSGGFIGESKEQQDNLRKAMEIPPRPPKPTRDSDSDSGKNE